MIVYIAKFPNGKIYVGATTQTLSRRKSDHASAAKAGVRNKFYNAIRKHGFESISWEIHSVHETTALMFSAERALIAEFNAQIKGYNTTIGGEGNPGRIINAEQRERISIAQKKRFKCERERSKTRAAYLEWIKENPLLHKMNAEKRVLASRKAETRNKISQSLKSRYQSNPDELVRLSAQAKAAYEERPEIREKISRSLGGSPVSMWKENELIAVFPTLSQCAREVGISIGNIGMVINGTRNHAKGFRFTRGQ